MGISRETYTDSNGMVYEKLPEISEEEFEKALEISIQKYVKSQYNETDEANKMEEVLESALLDKMNSGIETYQIAAPDIGGGGDALLEPEDTWVPDLYIENKYVAAAVNVIIDAVLVSIGVGSVSVALKRYGSEQLAKLFTASIKTKILGKGAMWLGGSIAVIVDFIFEVVSPGTKVAEWLDSIDDDKKNGYLDVIW